MRGPPSSLLALLAALTALASALPRPTTPLAPRALFCYNAPNTIAGTYLSRRSDPPALSHPARFTHPVPYCAPRTQTYILFTLTNPVPASALLALVHSAASSIAHQLDLHGDGVVNNGGFYAELAAGLMLRTWNADNHQTTWGVLGAVVGALVEGVELQMRGGGERVGAGEFRIFDGGHEVGGGSIG